MKNEHRKLSTARKEAVKIARRKGLNDHLLTHTTGKRVIRKSNTGLVTDLGKEVEFWIGTEKVYYCTVKDLNN